MNYTSIKRLGLDHMNIDYNNSYESFNPSTNNHSIFIHLLDSRRLRDISEYFYPIPLKKRQAVKYFSINLYDNIKLSKHYYLD